MTLAFHNFLSFLTLSIRIPLRRIFNIIYPFTQTRQAGYLEFPSASLTVSMSCECLILQTVFPRYVSLIFSERADLCYEWLYLVLK